MLADTAPSTSDKEMTNFVDEGGGNARAFMTEKAQAK